MNRRTFLTSLATVLAASAVPAGVAQVLAPAPVLAPPVVDWTAWNAIEIQSGPAGVLGRINGVDVTPFPDLMRMLARFIRVDPETQSVAFGTADCARGSGFRFEVPHLDETRPIHVGASVKLNEHVISKMTIDGSGRHRAKDLTEQAMWLDELSIHTVIPGSLPASAWGTSTLDSAEFGVGIS